MHITKTKATVAGVAAASAAVVGTFAFTSASAFEGSEASASVHRTKAHINPLNNSGAYGSARVEVRGQRLHVQVKARGLAKNLPHAQHIHFGAQARNECPDVFDDSNGDFRLETIEGVPAYGPVRVSLTTRGDTSAASVLAVDRYPNTGGYDYARSTKTSKAVAAGIRNGKAIVVIHGVDYNHNGEYDFRSAGKSDLNPDLPAEATDPAACGVLRVK